MVKWYLLYVIRAALSHTQLWAAPQPWSMAPCAAPPSERAQRAAGERSQRTASADGAGEELVGFLVVAQDIALP